MPFILFALICLVPTPAYAYLDPGTGSILLQGIIASIAAISGVFWMYWAKVKAFFARNGREKAEPQSVDRQDG